MDLNFLIKNTRVNNSISQNPIITQPHNILNNIKKLIIFTNGFTLSAANLLSNQLKEISIECLVLKEFISYKYIEAARINPELYLFIFSPQMQLARPGLVKNLPKNKYFLYQIEQLNQNEYPYQSVEVIRDQILNSIYTFDYSLTNFNLYPNNLKHKVKLLKPFINKIDNNNLDKTIDILFIGSLNDRRRKIIDILKKKNYKIEVVEKTFGDELINLIKKSKIVLNIHYYQNAILELFRIHDILPYTYTILSEEPGDGDPEKLVEKYKDNVKFFPILDDNLSNIHLLFNNIDSILQENIDIDNKKQFIDSINNNYTKNLYYLFHKKIRFQDYPLNILIRNTYRPSYFKKCITSILQQTNQNYKLLMCYDDDNCLEYLEQYKNNEKIEIFKAEDVDKNSQAFYNLYCNQLLDRVKDGWIIFLDDDDILTLPDTIQNIENNLNNINDFLFWKVKLGQKIVYPKDIYNIQLNFVSGIGFCFHSKFKDLARWDSNKGSDYRFITKLLSNNIFNRKFVNIILTGIQHTDTMGLLGKSENFNTINYLLKNTWIWKSDKEIPIEMTVALPALNAKKIIWLALESLKNQINVDFGWELIVFEENGISKDIVQSYKGLLPNCVKIIYKTLYEIDGYYNNNILKSNNFPTYYTLLEKWINIAKIADKNSKIFVKHAVDCYSPPNRLNIHYQHFKNKDCYYSTQSKGYFYNIKDNKYFLYDGIQIEPYNWKNYAKKNDYILSDRSINKLFSFRSCHLNMALRIDNIINLKLPNNPIKSGIDGYIIFSLFKSLNLHPEDKKIIWNDSEIDKDNWYKSLDTDGYNNISLERKKYYDMKIPTSPHCIPTHKSNVKLDIPEYIMERLKNL